MQRTRVLDPDFLVYCKEIKGLEIFFRLIWYGKYCFPTNIIHQLFIKNVKMLHISFFGRENWEGI